jgi:hypothetical protein
MLEEKMSVWPALARDTSLSGREGQLVCISIDVDARSLESLLECLARVDFPINPQIYHEAEMVYVFADGHEEKEPRTLVEFPAYEGRVEEVRRALDEYGFDPRSAYVTGMLEEIHSNSAQEPSPTGSRYLFRYRRKK